MIFELLTQGVGPKMSSCRPYSCALLTRQICFHFIQWLRIQHNGRTGRVEYNIPFPFLFKKGVGITRSLGPWIAHMNPCHEERVFTTKIIPISPTHKSILGITQIRTKAKSLSSIKIITYLHNFIALPFYPNHKVRGMHKVKYFVCIMSYTSFPLICNTTFSTISLTLCPRPGVEGV